MKRYAAVRRHKCDCCQWEDGKAEARAQAKDVIREALDEYQQDREDELLAEPEVDLRPTTSPTTHRFHPRV